MLEEEEKKKKKKKTRKLVDIDVDEITLCGSAATRKRFFITKSDDLAKIIEAANDFLGDDFQAVELEKSVDKEKLLDAFRVLKIYRNDMPDDVQDAIDRLAVYATQAFGYSSSLRKDNEDGALDKSNAKDDWPSIGNPGIAAIKKEDEDEPEEDEDEYLDPLERELHKINLRLDKMEGTDSKDPYPSIYIPFFNKIKKSESDPEPESKKKTGPVKTSIDGQENEITIEKESDEDPWPSIFDATIFKSS